MHLPWILTVGGLVLACCAAPLVGEAQQAAKVYRIGYLTLTPPPPSGGVSPPFRDALRELGYVEGQNLLIEARYADATVGRLPSLAAELVQLQVDVIVTIGTPPVKAAKEATTTIPIVMAGSADPVEHGLVESLAHPGGNVTGVTHSPGPEIAAKGLQLLKELVPTLKRIGVLWDSSGIHEGLSLEAQRQAAGGLGLTLTAVDAKTLSELTAAFETMKHARVEGVFVFPNFINFKHEQLILDFVTTHRLPSMFRDDDAVKDGGLLSYYTNWTDVRRHAAIYVDQVLKGAKPRDLPVARPTTFKLVINLKTAKALGLTIPPSVLARADEVFQ